MTRWNVTIGGASLEVEAANWLGALAVSLPTFGIPPERLGRLVCTMRDDGGVDARDPATDTGVMVSPVVEEAPPLFEMPQSSFAAINLPVAAIRVPEPAPPPPPRPPAPRPLAGPGAPPPPPRVASVVPTQARRSSAPTPPPPAAAPPRAAPPHAAAPTPVVARALPDLPEPPEETSDTADAIRRLDVPPPPAPTVPATTTSLNERLEDVWLLAGSISQAKTPSAACMEALRVVQQVVLADAGAVLIKDRTGSKLRFEAATGVSAAKVKGMEIPVDSGIAGFVTGFNLGISVADARKDERHLRKVDNQSGYRTQGLLAVPVRSGEGITFGCLELLNPPGAFSGDDLQVAAAVAKALAAFLVRSS